MLEILLNSHSAIRYVLLILLFWSLYDAWHGVFKDRIYSMSSKNIHLATVILLWVQAVIGVSLYIMGGYYWLVGKGYDGKAGFFADAHLLGMIAGILIITFGFRYALKAEPDKKMFKRVAVCYSIGTLIIFVHIPWPFIHPWGTWF